MLSDLPKIIGRGFVVGYLLPAALFCLYIQYLSFAIPNISSLNKSIEALKITPYIMSVLILSVMLMALNRTIIRTFEGYGRLNPFTLLKPIQIVIFHWSVLPLLQEAERIEKLRKTDPSAKSGLKNFFLLSYSGQHKIFLSGERLCYQRVSATP